MTKQVHGQTGAHAPLSRRDFLTRAGLTVGAAAAAAAVPGAAYAVQEGVIGDWAADGSKAVDVPDSAVTNASWSDGTYREHNGAAFPADDASPIPPRAVPATWDCECDICVVGAGGGGLNAAARAAEQGARTICVEAMGLHGGNAQEAGMCAILGGSKLQESKRFAFPSYPFDARKLADWAIDEYHYACDPLLIHRIAEAGGTCIDWMADCGVRWRLGEVPVYVAPKNSTLDHHVLKMKDATDAMFSFGQKHGVQYLFQSPAEALVQDGDGRIVGVVVREDYGAEKYIHAERAVILTAGGRETDFALEHFPDASEKDDQMKVTADGQQYDTDNFRNLYQVLMSIYRKGAAPAEPAGDPVLSIKLVPTTASDGVVELSIYKHDPNVFIVRFTTGETYAVNASEVNEAVKQLGNYLEGKDVKVN